MDIKLTVNGESHEVEIKPGDTLLKTLRRLGYYGVKHGCETGECGACTVLIDSKPA
ncbi:MAG: 2Fe-2S iron-sulfur cluster binding domain-containing protein, partial [Chloroflexota bacterium]